MDRALKRAIDKAGSARRLALQLGITQQSLSGWKRCPPLRVLEVEKLTGVRRWELRPDIYPRQDR